MPLFWESGRKAGPAARRANRNRAAFRIDPDGHCLPLKLPPDNTFRLRRRTARISESNGVPRRGIVSSNSTIKNLKPRMSVCGMARETGKSEAAFRVSIHRIINDPRDSGPRAPEFSAGV
jgi:hypothetical protein